MIVIDLYSLDCTITCSVLTVTLLQGVGVTPKLRIVVMATIFKLAGQCLTADIETAGAIQFIVTVYGMV